jgi:SAM-dependent methyltransferase
MQFRIFVRGMPLLTYLRGLPAFLAEYREIKRQAGIAPREFPFGPTYPCLADRDQESGTAAGHYFHQDLLVAGRIFVNRPLRHCDVGSRIDGLVAHVAAFRQIEVLDIRELTSPAPNIRFRRADLMDPAFALTDDCDSLSCLHVLEHFGLGRYGDRLDVQGHLRGWENLYRMLKKGGKLYFSVPIGEQRIEFNAHRVFSVGYLLAEMITDRYRLDAFSYVDDAGDLQRDPAMTPEAVQNSFGCHYGCGIFELTKS